MRYWSCSTNQCGRFATGFDKLKRFRTTISPTKSSRTIFDILQARSESSQRKTNYTFLHDFARHVIHSTETLGVALDTVNQIIEQQNHLMANVDYKVYQETETILPTDQYLGFQRQLFKSLKARSEANQLRLQNEINFVGQTRLLLCRQD